MYNIYCHYSLNWEFSADRRKSKPPSEMLKEYHIDFLEEELETNLDLNGNAMIKLIKDNYGIEVSKSTARRALHELGYSYVGTKISPKMLGKNNKKN